VGTRKRSGCVNGCFHSFAKKKKDINLTVTCFVQDHATGSLLVEEAGGVITDYRGRPLDFGLGRTLGTNYGVVAARKEVHAQVIKALQAVLAEEVTQEGESIEKKSSVRFFFLSPSRFLSLFDSIPSLSFS
jgi:hypothetical protein